jgi:hypothetical protein
LLTLPAKLKFITQVLQNEAVAGKVLLIAGHPIAYHAGPLLSTESSFPAAEMMIEWLPRKDFIGVTGVGAGGVRRCGTFRNFNVLTNGALPWILIVIDALFNHGL